MPKRALISLLIVYLATICGVTYHHFLFSEYSGLHETLPDRNFVSGLMVGLPLGVVTGLFVIKMFMARRVQGNIIKKLDRKQVMTYIFVIIAALILLSTNSVWNSLCRVFELQGVDYCLSAKEGILIGFLTGSMLIDGAWILLWERRNNQLLLFE